MNYEPPMWAEARANRKIYVTEDLARAAELEALRAYEFADKLEKSVVERERERAAMICHSYRDWSDNPAEAIAEAILKGE